MFVGVEELRSWLLRSSQMDPSKLLRASNDGKVEWNTTRCILPAEYATVILASDWLYFSRHGINTNIPYHIASYQIRSVLTKILSYCILSYRIVCFHIVYHIYVTSHLSKIKHTTPPQQPTHHITKVSHHTVPCHTTSNCISIVNLVAEQWLSWMNWGELLSAIHICLWVRATLST